MTDRQYTLRLVEPVITELFSQLPALLLTGPRATGKTTTARRYARSWVRLDREAEAVAFRADPDTALRSFPEPILLDEWQAVPAVLGAVKRAVDDDPRPGRFLLTGSVRADLDTETWPGTGRVVRLPMYGLTVREIADTAGPSMPFLQKAATGDAGSFTLPSEAPDLRGLVELALQGGFPEVVLRLTGRGRRAWLGSYLDQLLTRDVAMAGEARDPIRFRRYFEALALNTAGLVADTTLIEATEINRKTALAYERLLVNLFVLERLPAWSTNRLSRLVKAPKRYLVDPSLCAAAIGLDVTAVLRDGDMLGRLLDTFVMAQLRPEVVLADRPARLYHLRTEHGRHEVDIVAELGADAIVGLEVKATAAPKREDARHLDWLREQLGARFAGGVVLHTGPRSFQLADRIVAAPICTLWA